MTHEILEEVATKEEATERENYYIALYHSDELEFGYNKNSNKSYQTKLYKYVRCIETGEIFESMVAAGEKYGVSSEAIRIAIKKGHRSAGKHWERIEMTQTEYQLYRSAF